ncbi:unnamed protein product, partial [Mesorhabditis spiculigera]
MTAIYQTDPFESAAGPASKHGKPYMGPCLICCEPSYGKHYGVIACLGCKTFFRRAIVQRTNQECQREGQCNTETKVKRICRGCRLMRCFAAGMKLEALQPRRDHTSLRVYTRKPMKRVVFTREMGETKPSVSGEAALEEDGPSPGSSTPTPLEDMQFESDTLLELMQRLTTIDTQCRQQKADWIRSWDEARKLAHREGDMDYIEMNEAVGRRIILAVDVRIITGFEVHSMLDWVKSIPVFSKLKDAEKEVLCKRFAMPYQILEHGYFTAKSGVKDAWLYPNGSCMPRNMGALSNQEQIPEDRKWRQEKLYKEMTATCIDEVAIPLATLEVWPEELVTLKIILFLHCVMPHGDDDEISEESRKMCLAYKNHVIQALFRYYKNLHWDGYEERFGNLVLLIAGIKTAASAMLESLQVMRLFNIVEFDRLSTQLLFNSDQ